MQEPFQEKTVLSVSKAVFTLRSGIKLDIVNLCGFSFFQARGGAYGRSILNQQSEEHFSRQRRGFPFIRGGLGVEAVFATVRNRPQPFAVR